MFKHFLLFGLLKDHLLNFCVFVHSLVLLRILQPPFVQLDEVRLLFDGHFALVALQHDELVLLFLGELVGGGPDDLVDGLVPLEPVFHAVDFLHWVSILVL